MFDKLKARWYRIPKGVRFALHYGLTPVWLPLAVVIFFGMLIVWVVGTVVLGLYEEWENYK